MTFSLQCYQLLGSMTLENKTQTEKLSEDLTQARSEVL